MTKFNVAEKYIREDFTEFLTNFLPDDFEPKEENLYFDSTVLDGNNSYLLGESDSLDLAVYEFVQNKETDPRVTITKETVKLMKNYCCKNNVLAVFYNEQSNHWRLSLITSDVDINEKGKVNQKFSNPKRYSFLLGEGCKKHTPESMLFDKGTIKNLEDLISRFAIEAVTKEFYDELFAWYEWAVNSCEFNHGIGSKVDKSKDRNNEHIIRLITRIMFVWFLKQKKLIPDWIFNENQLADVLSDFSSKTAISMKKGNYYNAVIQNLFFATLNKKIEDRDFAKNTKSDYDTQYGIKTLFRDNNGDSFFKKSHDEILELFKPVPFLNGGLFECLDKLEGAKSDDTNKQIYADGFSREESRRAFVPNGLFWNPEETENQGLINLLNKYNFTVEENTPSDVQVALDPELLGKVFENLLGSYNEETKDSARKDSGSFYTPREIVSYMVDESIKAYLSEKLKENSESKNINEIIESVFDDESDLKIEIDDAKLLTESLYDIKVLDPACGSGAFPMGILNRLEHLIIRLSEYSNIQLRGSKDLKAKNSIEIKTGDKITYCPDDKLNVTCEYLGDYNFSVKINETIVNDKIKVDDMTLFVKTEIEKYNHDEKQKKTIANIFSQGHLNNDISFIAKQQKERISRIIDEAGNIIWEYKRYNTKNKKNENDEADYSLVYSSESTDKNHYNLKLHLIQNCIYGSDIQQIAAQISKLRFFISLICEQEKNDKIEDNYGLNPLPNLETKFVCANSLIGLTNHQDWTNDKTLEEKRNLLQSVREKHFKAPTSQIKRELRNEDKKLREEMALLLEKNHTTVNTDLIKLQKSQIKNWEKELETVKEPKLVEKSESIGLFGESKTYTVDVNKSKRDELKRSIAEARKNISEEEHKTADDAFKKQVKLLLSWDPYNQNASAEFFDSEWMFGITDGFDIVIGNPPYISTKGVSPDDKKKYEAEFGFSDDTYNLFTFKGLTLCKEKGTLNYIIPKTFWTTQTKRNMRDLILDNQINFIFDTADPFEAAMVDTCVIQIQKKEVSDDHKVIFLDGSKKLSNPVLLQPILQTIYKNTQNSVIFKPTKINLKIYEKYGAKVKELYDTWWECIKTSRDIENNKEKLEKYRKSLKPGDITLLGCLTEGGQGLATANNGKYIAVRKSSKWAKNILDSRPKKLAEAMSKKKVKVDGLKDPENTIAFLSNKTENEIAELFDNLKDKYGRDIFGQGYIFRLIDDDQIADVDTLTEDEKENGISTDKKFYVPYDKGDKDGNRWYLETPFAIAWSKENVHFLKTDPKARYQGYSFFFREGFCWNNVLNPNARLLKAKMKSASVNDVGSMSLSSIVKTIPNFYLVSILNSELLFDYYREFINCTVNIQINDIRQIPVIIPSEELLKELHFHFERAVSIKKEDAKNMAIESNSTAIKQVEEKINFIVENLYGI